MIALICAAIADDNDRNFMLQVYQNCNGLIRGVPFEMALKHNQVDDVEHNVIVKLINNMDTLKALDDNALLTYVYRTTMNCAFDLLKKDKNRGEQFDDELLYDKNFSQNSTEDYAIHMISTKNAVSKLSEKNREIIMDKFFLDLSDVEMGKKYHVKKDSVRMLVSRAKAELKKYLEEENED